MLVVKLLVFGGFGLGSGGLVVRGAVWTVWECRVVVGETRDLLFATCTSSAGFLFYFFVRAWEGRLQLLLQMGQFLGEGGDSESR